MLNKAADTGRDSAVSSATSFAIDLAFFFKAFLFFFTEFSLLYLANF